MTHLAHALPHATAPSAFDPLAGDYDRRWRRYIDATTQATTQWLDPRGGERILDLACAGELGRPFCRGTARRAITGVDLRRQMLRRARRAGRDRVGSCRPIRAACLADRSFDHVVTANSFHYFRSPRQCLDEMRSARRSADTGRLVTTSLTYKLCGLWCG
jgi:ubiquinone/menaquinone biosynthesis C-methylase UbiE